MQTLQSMVGTTYYFQFLLSKSKINFSIYHYRYKNVETLRSHQRRHRDQRKHLCSVCGKECSTNSSLSAHMRYVHLKISEYKCAICQRQFRRRLELTEHMARQHTGEVLYRCSFCPKTFASSSNYFAHRKNRHANEEADKVPTQLVS